MKNDAKQKTREEKLESTYEGIAKKVLGITLEEQKSDRDDFHEFHVLRLRSLIKAAYEAGQQSQR